MVPWPCLTSLQRGALRGFQREISQQELVHRWIAAQCDTRIDGAQYLAERWSDDAFHGLMEFRFWVFGQKYADAVAEHADNERRRQLFGYRLRHHFTAAFAARARDLRQRI